MCGRESRDGVSGGVSVWARRGSWRKRSKGSRRHHKDFYRGSVVCPPRLTPPQSSPKVVVPGQRGRHRGSPSHITADDDPLCMGGRPLNGPPTQMRRILASQRAHWPNDDGLSSGQPAMPGIRRMPATCSIDSDRNGRSPAASEESLFGIGSPSKTRTY